MLELLRLGESRCLYYSTASRTLLVQLLTYVVDSEQTSRYYGSSMKGQSMLESILIVEVFLVTWLCLFLCISIVYNQVVGYLDERAELELKTRVEGER